MKIFASVIAMILVLAYLAPPVIKLKDPALTVVIIVGVALMVLDIWQSIRSKDE